MKLTQTTFSANQYIAEEYPKKQIYLHHTAGSADPFAVFKVWENNPEKIATCVTVGGKPTKTAKWIDGEVVQGFSSKHWAYHLGLKESTFHNFKLPYKSLDKISIGIEVCNFGGLTYREGKYYTYVNSVIPEEDVIMLPKEYKGYKYVHAYTDAQIQAIKELLLLWKEKYNITLTYNEDIWDVTPRALKGDSGVFTHNSVRYDKIDVTPQPKLIEMLKSL